MRPAPDTFNPFALVNPDHVRGYRAFVDRVYRGEDMYPPFKEAEKPPPVFAINPSSWCRQYHRAPSPKPQGLWDRLLTWLIDLESPEERAEKAKKALLREGVVWGLWSGFFAGASAGADEGVLNDWYAASVYATNPDGIDLPFWSEVLLSTHAEDLSPPPPPRGDPAGAAPARDPRVRPALPPQALFKPLLLGPTPRREHFFQVLRAAAWDPVRSDLETWATNAPSLPGLMASAVFAVMAKRLAEGEWAEPNSGWRPTDPLSAWVKAMADGGASLEGDAADDKQAVRDLGWATNCLKDREIWRRHRPLRPPFSCVDLLHVALWANMEAASFDEVMEAVRALGGDALACAAAGAFAGGRFGKDALPSAAMNHIPPPARARVAEMAQRYTHSNLA